MAHDCRPLGAVLSILAPLGRSARNQLRFRRGRVRRKGCQFSLAVAASETMSIRQPVSFAARRAFWPSLPMASDSW
jgi:hypothetical protein